MMLLVIDIGNTNTAFALHSGTEWIARWRSSTDPTRTADDYAVWLGALMAMEGLELSHIRACILSSVVPQAKFNFRNLSRRYFDAEPVFVGEPETRLGIPIRIDRPEQVGADRLVAAIGAHQIYPGPLLVIDSGTATTFDVIGADGGFEGGIISPGINLSMRALHDAAAQLPRIAIERPSHVIGQNTVEAMQSGVFWGYVNLIDGLVRQVKAEYKAGMTVVATGGVASLFEGASDTIDHFDHTLMEVGLLEVYRRNLNV
ncbi:MAG: type III pantothenate kinase [Pseudomonadota bacterium]